MRLLLVEGETRIAHFMAKGLREQGFTVDFVEDDREALCKANTTEYDLLIIDVTLPLKNGLEVCKEIRRRGIRRPVLLMASPDVTDNPAIWLDCGADEYLQMPFGFEELLARIRFLLRRAEEYRPEIIRIADLTVHTRSQTVIRGARQISLTMKEYYLLEFFMLRAGQPVHRDEIAELAWGENPGSSSNTIDVYVKRLGKKIDDGFNPPLIHTRPGEAYLLSAETEDDSD